jgi:hypothetical protein
MLAGATISLFGGGITIIVGFLCLQLSKQVLALSLRFFQLPLQFF